MSCLNIEAAPIKCPGDYFNPQDFIINATIEQIRSYIPFFYVILE